MLPALKVMQLRGIVSACRGLEQGAPRMAEKARAYMRDYLTLIAPLLAKKQYLLSEEYSILDLANAIAMETGSL